MSVQIVPFLALFHQASLDRGYVNQARGFTALYSLGLRLVAFYRPTSTESRGIQRFHISPNWHRQDSVGNYFVLN
jgi:hypothetical protein